MRFGITLNTPFFSGFCLSVYPCLAITAILACSRVSEDNPIHYGEIAKTRCDSDSSQTYHYAVPRNLAAGSNLPLIIILDAHGDGKMAVQRFLEASGQIPCVIAGSDVVRNGYPQYMESIEMLISDIGNKFPVVGDQLILAGFSGGARMALEFSLRNNIRGLLMMAAGILRQRPECRVFGITGTRDFNFPEQYYRPNLKALQNTKRVTDHFSGGHEWPPGENIRDGILFLLKGSSPEIDSLAGLRSWELAKGAEILADSGYYLRAWKSLEKSYKMAKKSDLNARYEKTKSFVQNREFRNSVHNIEQYMNNEMNIRQMFMQQALERPFDYWNNELTGLNFRLSRSQDPDETDHFLRIKGFMGILFFSRLNNLLHNDKDNEKISVLLEAFELLEPENPDVYYFKALYASQQGDSLVKRQNLIKAVDIGFTDDLRMKMDFPEESISFKKEKIN